MLELADKAEPAPVLCGLLEPAVPFALAPSVSFPEEAPTSESFSSLPETVEEEEEVLEAEAEPVLDAEVPVAVADGRAVLLLVMVRVTAVSGWDLHTNGESSSSAGGLVSGKSRALGVVGAGLGDVANDPVLAGSAEDLGVSWVGLNAVLTLVYAPN